MIFNRKKAKSEKSASKEKADPDTTSNKIIDEDLDQNKDDIYEDETDSELIKEQKMKEAEPASEENQELDAIPEDELNEEKDSMPESEMSLKQASELAKKRLSQALNKPANATISIENQGDTWLAIVEIVEEEYLPGQNLKSMNDLLGVYEVSLSNDGKLLKWTRKSSYKRAEIK